jgi:hypothetical protein
MQPTCKRSLKRVRDAFDADDVQQFCHEMLPTAPLPNLTSAIVESKLKITGLERLLLQERQNLLSFEVQSQKATQTVKEKCRLLTKAIVLYKELHLPLKVNKCYRQGGNNYCGIIATGKIETILGTQVLISFDNQNEIAFMKKSRYHKKNNSGFEFKISQFIKTSSLLLFSRNGVFLQVNTRFPDIYRNLAEFLIPEITKIVLEFLS